MVKFMDMAGLSRLNAELAAVACPPGGDTVVTCTVEVYSCKATTSDKRVSHSLEQRMGAAAAAATDEWAARHTLPSASLSAHLRKVLIYLVLVLNATFPDYDFTGAATALPEAFETYTVAEVQARVDAALEEVYRYVDAEGTGSAVSFDEAPDGAAAEAPPSQRPTPANVAASRGDGDRRASRPRADRASHRKRKRSLVAAGAPTTTTTALPTRHGGSGSASDGRTPSPRPLSLVAPPRSSARGMRERLWAALHEAINLPACEAYAYEGLSDGDGPFHEPGVLWSFNYFLYNHAWRRVAFLRCVAAKVPSPVLASPAPSEGAVSAVRPIPVARRPAWHAASGEVEAAGEGGARRAADAPASPRWHDSSLIFDFYP
ncbi:hypothetical protein CDCA_CDCA01G0261 [Cyanidium caldarium]|uniref:Repressor of RNA polymerase III transcription n=1 Tax=Cyanidium caldarium TaxID=2771 RepID=A0AAV9IQ69_CYACA|nr:hypothetical protein CDCA_CDCA01G0261 [Cyanidium caldarium]